MKKWAKNRAFFYLTCAASRDKTFSHDDRDDNISPILNAARSRETLTPFDIYPGKNARGSYNAIIIIMIPHTIHDKHVTSRKAAVAARSRNSGSPPGRPPSTFVFSFLLFSPIQRAKIAFQKRPFPLSARTEKNRIRYRHSDNSYIREIEL